MAAVIPTPFPKWTLQLSRDYVWPKHAGADFSSRSGGVWKGDPIYASGPGTVRYSGRVEKGGGNTSRPGQAAGNAKVVVYDGDAFGLRHAVEVRYCHLDSFDGAQVGDRVQRGDLIGYVGSSGLSTAPHLHLEVWVNGGIRNPFDWLDFDDLATAAVAGTASNSSKSFAPEREEETSEMRVIKQSITGQYALVGPRFFQIANNADEANLWAQVWGDARGVTPEAFNEAYRLARL